MGSLPSMFILETFDKDRYVRFGLP
jgi:hypothetical protein